MNRALNFIFGIGEPRFLAIPSLLASPNPKTTKIPALTVSSRPRRNLLRGQGGLHCHVKVNGRGMHFRAEPEGLFSPAVARELDVLHAIHHILIESPNTLVRIPKLFGYLRHAEVGCAISYLREWTSVSSPECTTRGVNVLRFLLG